jgi:hypothetical protein
MALTKTSVLIVAVVTGAVLAVGTTVVVKKVQRARQAARAAAQKARVADWQASVAVWRTNEWVEERNQEIARIKSRARADETTNAVIIDLRPYINAKLTDAPSCWKNNNANNLAELPAGRNIYAGVPFDVEGSIQLTGGWLKDHYKKTYPVQVTNIFIDQRCTKLHLLHGNSYLVLTNFGTVVAKLVLHYEDGSSRTLNLVGGEQSFDFWCPLFTTGIPEKFFHTAPGTERAWTGSNAHIRKWQPDLTLVLYKTTLENPQPDIRIYSLDYVSTETMTAPLLVALTVE